MEDLLKQVQNGDVDAMRKLAEHYEDSGLLSGYAKAVEWREKSAILGDKRGSLLAAWDCITIGKTLERDGDPDEYDDAEEIWRRALLNAAKALKCSEDDWDDTKYAMEAIEESEYFIATHHYRRGIYEEVVKALQLVRGGDAIRINLLFALAYAYMNKGSLPKEGVDAVHSLMLPAFLEKNKYATADCVGKATRIEQVIFARVVEYLASTLEDEKTMRGICELAKNALSDNEALNIIYKI